MPNYVDLLQQKCIGNLKDLPLYSDVETNEPNPVIKKIECRLYGWTTEGSGLNKKIAKQNAAQLMLNRVENDSEFVSMKSASDVTQKLNIFCTNNGMKMPLCSEKARENGFIVVECIFYGFTATGRGRSLKAARANAYEEVANHFDIDTYLDYQSKRKQRVRDQRNPVNKLFEFCQANKFPTPVSKEEVVRNGGEKFRSYVVTYSVNELVTQSKPNISMTQAKIEAAELMLNELDIHKVPQDASHQPS